MTAHDPASKIGVIRTLVQVRADDPLPILGPLSRDPDPAVRAEAVAALYIGGKRAAPFVAEALADPDEAVRARAVDSVARLELAEHGADLLALVTSDPSTRVRERAALGIGLLRVSGGDAALLAACRGTQPPEVLASAVLAIGAYEGESMVGRIAAMVDDAPVRATLQQRLRDDAEYRLLGRRLRQSRHLELRALAASSREGMQAELTEAMRSTLDAPERVRLVAGLRAFQGERSRDALLGILRGDPSAEVRAAALAAVSPMLSGESLVAAARIAVADPSPAMRKAGVTLLDQADAARTLPIVLRALRADESPTVLEEIAARADQSFDAFADTARELVHEAAHAVALARVARYMHHRSVARLLPPLAASPSPVVRGALAELWIARPDLVTPELIDGLAADPVTAVRRQAARAAAAAQRYDVLAGMVADPDADAPRARPAARERSVAECPE